MPGLFENITRMTRRALTGVPSNVNPESHNAWVSEQIRAYATLQPFAGPLTGVDNLTGETWEMREAYRRFALKEPASFAALLNKTLDVCRLPPQVLPEDKSDPDHKAAAAYVDWSISRSSGGWPQTLFNVAYMGQVDGFSVTEKVFDVLDPHDATYPGWWTLKAAKGKDSLYIRLRLDTYKNVVGVQAMNAGQGGVPIPTGDVILFTYLKIFESPFGLSAYRQVYRAVTLIAAAIKLRSILLENFSGPFLQATAGDPAAREQVGAILAMARARGWIVMPEGATLDVKNLATSAPDQFQNTIEDLRKEIYLGVQGAYLQALESDSPQGNASEHSAQTTPFKWWLSVTLAATLTEQLVPDLVEPNIGRRGGRPIITLGGVDPAEVKAAGDRIKQAQEIGLDVSKSYAYELIQVEPPRGPDDVLKPPSAQPPAPPGGAGPFGFADGIRQFAEYGRQGLTLVETTDSDGHRVHRWVRQDAGPPAPTQPSHAGDQAPAAADTLQGLAQAVGATVTSNPTLWQKVQDRAKRVHEAAYVHLATAGPKVLGLLGEVLDMPTDFEKLGYNPGFSGVAEHRIHDPVAENLGIGSHLAMSIASHVLARVAVYAKRKIAGRQMADDSDGIAETVDFLCTLLPAVYEAAGRPGWVPDRAAIERYVREKAEGGAARAGSTFPAGYESWE